MILFHTPAFLANDLEWHTALFLIEEKLSTTPRKAIYIGAQILSESL